VLLAIGSSDALAGAGMAAPAERVPPQPRMALLEQKPIPTQVLSLFLNLAQHQLRSPTEHQLNAEERMRRRFPQPVRVGDLVSLRVWVRRDSCFKATEATLGESYGNHAYSVFSIGSQNNESELDAVE
jgi:hypothetical protein